MADTRTVYGMDKAGKPIYRLSDAVRESILDILSTPRGSRPMRPTYGLNMLEIVDRPVNEALDLYIVISEAITEWEPRYKLKDLQAESEGGKLRFSLFGELRESREPLNITGAIGG